MSILLLVISCLVVDVIITSCVAFVDVVVVETYALNV